MSMRRTFGLQTVLAGMLSLAGVSSGEWSLENPPPVPPPAAEDSKQPADPKDFEELKMDFPIAPGPFQPTWESIRANYPGTPAWFREAKFGVFIHWGPQASGRSGDWYARNLYREGSPAYTNHLRAFGHPSEFGYKDVLNAWTAPKWDPERLMRAFHDAGMRFALAVGVHHDNFDLWDSAYQPWNSVNIGPKRDMIGAWSREAKKMGMRFGITFHHEYTWWWWADAFRADKQGPKAGIPYDGRLTKADGVGKRWEGLDPRLLYTIDLREYNRVTEIAFGRQGIFQDHLAWGAWYAEWWARRIQDAIEKYDPDMFYTDGNSPEPFSGLRSGAGLKCDAGRRVVAHFYNRALAKHGKVDTLALIKFQAGNPSVGMTSEVTVPGNIKRDQPWIGENPVGDWYYGPNYHYDAINLVRSLLENASRDGNYACAVPIAPEGDLEPACLQMLKDMGEWMRINGEGLYGSRAWKTLGEDETTVPNAREPARSKPRRVFEGKLDRSTAEKKFSTADFRFTVGRDGSLYAWCLAVPQPHETVKIKSLGANAGLLDAPVASVSLLGTADAIQWTQTPEALTIVCPVAMPFRYAVGFKIRLAR